MILNSVSYLNVNRADTEALDYHPSCQSARPAASGALTTEAEASERMDLLKAEITKERRLQARTIKDTTSLEESHMRDVGMLRFKLEEVRTEQRKLEAQAAVVECCRTLNLSLRNSDIGGRGSTTAPSKIKASHSSIEGRGLGFISSRGRCSELPLRRHRNSELAISSSSPEPSGMISPTARTPSPVTFRSNDAHGASGRRYDARHQ